MKSNEGRESAVVVSRVKDLSKIDNRPDFVGLFACITPFGEVNKPTLINSVDQLNAVFGDPRIDPSTYRDLYTIRNIISSGISVYISRVSSGNGSTITVSDDSDELFKVKVSVPGSSGLKLTKKTVSTTSTNYCLVDLTINGSVVVSGKVTYTASTKNSDLVNSLNSLLDPWAKIELSAEESESTIAEYINDLSSASESSGTGGSFTVDLNSYKEAFNEYEDSRFAGNMISELSSPITSEGSLVDLDSSDRRSLQNRIKEIAALRKDLTCIFAPPASLNSVDSVCDWVSSEGTYSGLVEYGTSSAIDYADQSFYCEMYWGWLNWKVSKVTASATESVVITVPASGFVILNSLLSFRERGVSFPVAGDQGGVLPEECTVVLNPKTKLLRDKLVQNRINPIYDTGTRGVQIYGNETLNPAWTDLSAAHSARLLVLIRNRVHEFTESIKFMLNDVGTWQLWKNTVTTNILDPYLSEGGISWFEVSMGYDTTSRSDISARKIKGVIRLQFVPDAEIFSVDFVVESSSAIMG